MDENRLQDHLDNRFDSLDSRLDRVEAKLDSHLDRLSKAEESVAWLKGHVKFSMSILLAVVGGLLGTVYNFLIK